MRKVSKKIISCFVLCALMISSIMGFAITSNAADVDSGKIQREDGTYVYYVNTQSSFGKAVRNANDGDCIEFTDDVVYSGAIFVRKNITIDFKGSALRFVDTSSGLNIDVDKSKGITLKNGAIYGANDSNSAVYIYDGKVSLKCMEVYGGNCKNADYYSGFGIFGESRFKEGRWIAPEVYMDDCYIRGGNGYKARGMAGYPTSHIEIISEGKGYTEIRGERKVNEQ